MIRTQKRSLRRFLELAVVAAAAGILLAAWFRPRQPAIPPGLALDVLAPKPGAVAPGVYLLGESAPSAAYVVDTTTGLVLIDSGVDADAATILNQAAKLGLDLRHLQAILLTHVHADHSFGAARLRDRTGAKVYAGRGDAAVLREGRSREAFFSTYPFPKHVPHPTTVDVELQGGETIVFGDVKIQAVAAPGHTPGSVCYLLERPGLRALFTGDVIQCLRPPGKGSLGTYAAFLPPVYRGNAQDYLASLHRLRDLPVPDLVLPGHPRMDVPAQDPHLSRERWLALLDGGIQELERVIARFMADGANFLDGNPKRLLPGLHYLGDFAQTAVYGLETPGGLYLFDAPGGAELVDFLAAQFKAVGWEGRKPAAVLLTGADPATTAGLEALVKATGCHVVAPAAGVEEVRKRCPKGATVLTPDAFRPGEGVNLRPIPLSGRGLAPQAYLLKWAQKTVLVSGRFLANVSPLTMVQTVREVNSPGGGAQTYASALDALERLRPQVWLPAQPVHGQNANLYDGDWDDTVESNRRLFR